LNNLRRDIRSAFQVIEPPLGGMPERVVQTVLAEKNGRLRKENMVYRLRISLALVAAVLVLAVGAAAVITWNSLHNANTSPAGVGLTPLQQLEARPLVMPRASSEQTCTHHPGANTLGFNYGDGPIYGNGGPETSSSWGYYWDVTYYVAANVPGPILVRGEDLMSGKAMVFVGSKTDAAVTGAAAGTDPAQSPPTLRNELVLDPTKSPHAYQGFGWFSVRQGLPKDYVGCFGIQMDGPTFSEWISHWVAP
jgi:hypothetical protein